MSEENKCPKCGVEYALHNGMECLRKQLATVTAERDKERELLALANADINDLKQRVKNRDADHNAVASENATLRAKLEDAEKQAAKEKNEADEACKRAGDRWQEYEAERQDHNITKRELAQLKAEVERLKSPENGMNCPKCGWKLVGDFKVYAQNMHKLDRLKQAGGELAKLPSFADV